MYGFHQKRFYHLTLHIFSNFHRINPLGCRGGRFGPPPSSFCILHEKNLKLTPPETSWLFINISCTEFHQKDFSKILSDPLSKLFLKKCQKMTGKKVVGSKNVFYKSCWEFYILVGDFFSRGKKVIKSKKDFNKSCPKFCKLGDNFFLFWRKSKRLYRHHTHTYWEMVQLSPES